MRVDIDGYWEKQALFINLCIVVGVVVVMHTCANQTIDFSAPTFAQWLAKNTMRPINVRAAVNNSLLTRDEADKMLPLIIKHNADVGTTVPGMSRMKPMGAPGCDMSVVQERRQKRKLEEEDEQKRQQALASHRRGLDIWHSFTSVVCLETNVRSSGTLSHLLHELRNGTFSLESWHLLQQRKLGYTLKNGIITKLPPGKIDPRLLLPPFSNHPINFVVARHRLRVSQTFSNALADARRSNKAVYLMKALDVAAEKDAPLFTEQRATALLDDPDLNATKRTPGLMALWEGMRLVLNSKDCQTLALMNGAECVQWQH